MTRQLRLWSLSILGLVGCGGGDFETGNENGDSHQIVPDGGGPCSDATTVYLDGDGDGHGSTTSARVCDVSGSKEWVASGGDCDDGNVDVHPGQSSYFEHGYQLSGTSELSFDYDCSGSEEESGSSPKVACTSSGLGCSGGGYTEAKPARNGVGVNPFCGSTEQASCVKSGLSCEAGPTFGASAIACR